jgi:hypothetical protein
LKYLIDKRGKKRESSPQYNLRRDLPIKDGVPKPNNQQYGSQQGELLFAMHKRPW